METNEKIENKQTKFEELLSQMPLYDKHEVFSAIAKVNNVFKKHVEKTGGKWLDVMSADVTLRNTWICESIAGQMWFDEYRKKETEVQK